MKLVRKRERTQAIVQAGENGTKIVEKKSYKKKD